MWYCGATLLCIGNLLKAPEDANFRFMKKIFSFALLLLGAMAVQAQQNVTQFLGIPIDGSKQSMLLKLKNKGFRSTSYDSDILKGEFNGREVTIHVVTNNNKVYRIMLSDVANVDERSIQIRFNTLCEQFANNPRYFACPDREQTIPDDEDISYEMTVNKKRYEAVFYQKPDSIAVREKFKAVLLEKYMEEQLENPTEEIQEEIQSELYKFSMMEFMEDGLKRSVWFKISEFNGRYYISMYYDNEYNRANGEDL